MTFSNVSFLFGWCKGFHFPKLPIVHNSIACFGTLFTSEFAVLLLDCERYKPAAESIPQLFSKLRASVFFAAFFLKRKRVLLRVSPYSFVLLIFVAAFVADNEFNGSTLKAKDFTEFIFDISLIREMEEFSIINEQHESRSLNAGLSHIIDFKAFTLIRRRLNACSCVGEDIIKHTGRYSHRALVINVIYKLINAIHSLTCLSGNKEYRRISHIGQCGVHIFSVLVHCVGIFLYKIPLINNYDDSLTAFMSDTGNSFVLCCNALRCVDYNKADICAFDRPQLCAR